MGISIIKMRRLWDRLFLHDRPWISPWIKWISNELDITCHVFASQLSGHCDVITNRLWHHQQNVRRASKTRGWCVKILVFSVIYGFLMLCKKWNNVCTLVTREINTKRTLLWADKQFVTWVHTSLYIFIMGIAILVRQHLYTEMGPYLLVVLGHHQ